MSIHFSVQELLERNILQLFQRTKPQKPLQTEREKLKKFIISLRTAMIPACGRMLYEAENSLVNGMLFPSPLLSISLFDANASNDMVLNKFLAASRLLSCRLKTPRFLLLQTDCCLVLLLHNVLKLTSMVLEKLQ